MKLSVRLMLRSLAAGMILVPALSAQSQTQLKKKYEEKLALDFIEYGGWMTEYDAARARAKKEDKVLFVYFSRSYAP